MPSLLQTGILELSDDEFMTLIEIFDTFPETTMLASSYVCVVHGLSSVPITDAMIAEMINLYRTLEKEDKRTKLIDHILEFRSKAELTIA